MADIIATESPDGVIFLGDYLRDCIKLQKSFSHLPFYAVPGNNDYGSGYDEEGVLELDGVKIFLTHGHYYFDHSAESTYANIAAAAKNAGADAAFFGHSHLPLNEIKNGITLLNPGSITEPRGNSEKSYAIINILNGKFTAKIIEI